MPTERLADRTHHGPDHRHPDDVPLPGTEPDPDAWAPEPVDLERLARWARPVERPTVRPEYL